jgi:hypothetical protein
MECLTKYLQPVPGAVPWLYRVSQAILQAPHVASHAAARDLTPEQRADYAERAAEALSQATVSLMHGFQPMANGADKKQDWKAKAYVNITGEELLAQVTGPLGSRDEDKRMNVAIPPGHAIVACSVALQGVRRPRFMRRFTSPKHGTKGVVFVGLCTYAPQQMPPCAAAAPAGPTTRARAARCRKQYLRRLNDAYQEIEEDAFVHLRDLLDLKSDEEADVYCMKPVKRRKLQAAFNMLAMCDDTLHELAQSVAEDADGGEPASSQPAASQPAASQRSCTDEDFARSEKCICGRKAFEGNKVVGRKVVGKKVVGCDKMGKGKKGAAVSGDSK